MQGWLKVRDGARQAVNRLLERLMSQGVIDGLLVPLRTLDDRNVVPTLIRDLALLERAEPLAPVLPRNAGEVLGRITATGPTGRLGAVLRTCELRTVVELAKVQQALLAGEDPAVDVLLIGIDCLGTYTVETYAHMVDQGEEPLAAGLSKARLGRVEPLEGEIGGHRRTRPPYAFRSACSMCEQPVPLVPPEPKRRGSGSGASAYAPHIAIGLLGVPNDQQLWVTVRDEELAEVIGLEPASEEPPARAEAVASFIDARTAERDRRFAALQERVHGPESLLAEFATCIGCRNCMEVCPICYCKECIFRTDIFDHPSTRYWDWAERKGGVRLPSDTLLFHLTRMLHMAHACVGCGMCSDACPVGIDVADIFRAVGQQVQARFGYVPGRDPDEEMVIATFREDELETLGT
jgi:formate dehydrogenase subunit beta